MSKTMLSVLAGSAGIFFVLTRVPVAAHHSFSAEYDANQPVTITGEVTRVEWANPHIYYYLAVKNEGGQVTEWAVEGTAPNALFRRGWRRDTLKPGDIVTVEGFKARIVENRMNGRNTTLPDGRRLFSGSNDGTPGNTN